MLGGDDLLRGDAAKMRGDSQFGKDPDEPFRRVPLPRFHPVAVIVLKFVVIVVVALAQSEEREKE